MSAQIHIKVTEKFWKSLFNETALWPKDRSRQGICRYALNELYNAKFNDPGDPLPKRGPKSGTCLLQVHARTPDESDRWEKLGQQYESKANALRIALQYLHDSLHYEEPEKEPVRLEVTSAEVARWRKQRSVSPSGSGR